MTIYKIPELQWSDEEAYEKGRRDDLVLENEGHFYRLNIYDSISFRQEVQREVSYYGYSVLEPNLIILNEVTRNEIENVLKKEITSDTLTLMKEYEVKNGKLIIANNANEVAQAEVFNINANVKIDDLIIVNSRTILSTSIS